MTLIHSQMTCCGHNFAFKIQKKKMVLIVLSIIFEIFENGLLIVLSIIFE